MMENKAIRKYCARISGCLVCSRREKRRMLDQIRRMCRDYLSEFSGADYDALVARFGTPEQIAGAYVDEMEPVAVLDGFRLRRRIVSTVAIGMAAVVMIWMLAVGGALVNEVKHADGYYEVAVYVD